MAALIFIFALQSPIDRDLNAALDSLRPHAAAVAGVTRIMAAQVEYRRKKRRFWRFRK